MAWKPTLHDLLNHGDLDAVCVCTPSGEHAEHAAVLAGGKHMIVAKPVDLLQWMMGPVAKISAYTATLAHERIEVEDTAVARVRFASGAFGMIEGTTAAYPGLTARLEMHGSRGSAIIDSDELVYYHSAAADDEGRAYGASGGGNQAADVSSQYPPDPHAAAAGADPASLLMAHREQIGDFIAAIRQDREPLVNIEKGRKPVAIIRAIYESARTSKPVSVS